MKIVVDYSVCESNGICVGLMPDVFELADSDNLNVLQDDVTPENVDDVHEAVRQCPRQAIAVVE